MALSVSAFPEHIQARHSSDVFPTAEDPSSRNAPRILGFFGGVSTGASSKKPESREDPNPATLQFTPWRHQPSPSPIRNRLEIGAATRTLPFPTQKSYEPSRPLPILPNPASDSSKPPSSSSLGSKPASSIIIPSRSASGSSKLPTPRQTGITSRKTSLPSTASPITPPSSKVLITRGHNSTSSVSIRYQSLVVDPLPTDTPAPAPSSPNEPSILAPSAIRPLPRLPPSSSFALNFALPSSANPIHSPLKRPRTSPSSFSGFSGLTGSSSSAVDPRSAFETIPCSWASKPSGLSSSKPASPPSKSAALLRTTTTMHPRRLPSPKMSRARSLSRPRKERSLDSYPRFSAGTSRTPPGSSFAPSAGVGRTFTVGRYGSQAVPGARPLTKNPTLTPTVMARQQQRRDSFSASGASALGKSPTHQITSSLTTRDPSLRHVRPQGPSGPVMRTKSMRTTTTSPPRFDSSKPPLSAIQISDSTASSEALLHVHPIMTSLAIDMSTESPNDSPLEFFVDGPETDVASVNRSPSPIRYALPSDNGELSDWNSINDDDETTDDDLGGMSSSTSNSRGFAAGRRRTQLRSYQMDYGPQVPAYDFDGRKHADDATIQAKPARALPVPPREKKKGKEENKKKEKWSFGDFTSMGSLSSPSTPATRASSPERKGRSRQPRRLAEAVSLALGSGSRDITASRSSSGRASVSGAPPLFAGLSTYASHMNGVRLKGGGGVPTEYEVLDIRMPSFEGKDEPRNNARSLPVPLDFRIPDSPDTPTAFVNRNPVVIHDGSDASGGVHWVTKEGKRSGLRDTTSVESRIVFRNPSDDDYESDEMPFRWWSKDRSPEKPAVPELGEGASSVNPDREEAFPAMVSSVGHAPLSTSLVDPTTRGAKNDKIRKQRTTSGPSRFDLTGGGGSSRTVSAIKPAAASSVDPHADAPSMSVPRAGLIVLEGPNHDDIYCDEDQDLLEVEKPSESKRRGHGEDSLEARVEDVIPLLRSL